MSCNGCGAPCFGPICAKCKGESPHTGETRHRFSIRDVAQATINVLGDKSALLRELVEASKPIVEWREKLEAWDGGCGLPDKPQDWQWKRFRDAVKKAEDDERSAPLR